MFVHIIHNKGQGNSHSTFIECSQVAFGESSKADLMLRVEKMDGRERLIDIDKSTDEVYLLNNVGKTIDSYKWAYELGDASLKP